MGIQVPPGPDRGARNSRPTFPPVLRARWEHRQQRPCSSSCPTTALITPWRYFSGAFKLTTCTHGKHGYAITRTWDFSSSQDGGGQPAPLPTLSLTTPWAWALMSVSRPYWKSLHRQRDHISLVRRFARKTNPSEGVDITPWEPGLVSFDNEGNYFTFDERDDVYLSPRRALAIALGCSRFDFTELSGLGSGPRKRL